MPRQRIDKCSCPESAHLRVALTLIRAIATQDTRGSNVSDLAMIGNLADQALDLKSLTAGPFALDGYLRDGNA